MPDGSGDMAECRTGVARAATSLSLRLLATTDMHMKVLPYDYFADRECDRGGLARVASLIERRRAERPNCLLLDNGDFLQGTPMGDYAAARHEAAPRRIHPAIAAMNAMGYDAAALGNHDFNFGLSFLRSVTARARFPFLAANLQVRRGPGFDGHVILRRVMTDDRGEPVPLSIAIAGFVPPQTTAWDRDLSDQIMCFDIIETARSLIPALRAAGADLVVALAHSGIGAPTASPGMENAAAALAALPGLDAVIAGHTHEVFPGPRIRPRPGVDPKAGTLAGKPAVMAGFGGSHLGIIDLDLAREPAGSWRIRDFAVRAEPVDPGLPTEDRVARPVLAAHRETLRNMRRRVGRSATALTSYFALIGDDPGSRLVNLAQRWHVRRQLKNTPWQDLPLLSASAPFRAGGRGGPRHYTDVPAGALSLRNLADLYVFPNRICAIRLTGAQLAEWLERSASLFHQISPGQRDAALIDPAFPCYNFDVIDGVRWRIDLSQPARFAPDGAVRQDGARRIRDLSWQGRPVTDQDVFVLATNSYRMASCGLFSPLVRDNTVALGDGPLTRDILHRYVRRRRRIAIDSAPHWRFVPMPGTSAIFETGPGALDHLPQAAARHAIPIEPCGEGPDGFARLRLHL